MKNLTINLEVVDDCDTNILLEAITKLIHEGEQSLTIGEQFVLLEVADVTEVNLSDK